MRSFEAFAITEALFSLFGVTSIVWLYLCVMRDAEPV